VVDGIVNREGAQTYLAEIYVPRLPPLRYDLCTRLLPTCLRFEKDVAHEDCRRLDSAHADGGHKKVQEVRNVLRAEARRKWDSEEESSSEAVRMKLGGIRTMLVTLLVQEHTLDIFTPERGKEALAAFKRGEFVMVMDADDREDECDLILAAETVTAEQMAFAIRQTTGIVCIVSDKERLEHFGLHPATGNNTDSNQTNFYVSTDFLPGTTTGVSAADRAATCRALCDISHGPEAFSKPGHLFPLCARPGGVLERPGAQRSDSCSVGRMFVLSPHQVPQTPHHVPQTGSYMPAPKAFSDAGLLAGSDIMQGFMSPVPGARQLAAQYIEGRVS
ncbi:unnamed protein product, partial [Polarella glacialis]